MLVGVGLVLWVWPVSHSKPAPDSAKCTDAKTCWVKVDDAPEILLSTLVVLGALLVLVGVNGRRLVKFTGPGGTGFSTQEDQAADDAKGKAETKAAEKGLTASQTEVAKAFAAVLARDATRDRQREKGGSLSLSELSELGSRSAEAGVSTVAGNPEFS